MSKKHDIVAALPTGEGPVNEYDSIIVERDREFEELIRLGEVERDDSRMPDEVGASTDQMCGQPATLAGFAVTLSTRLQQRRANITLRPATDDDCIVLGETMRQADREDLVAFSDRSPLEALRSGLSVSTYAVTAVDADGRVICMFGVGSDGFMSDRGHPWLVSSELLGMHWRLFARLSYRYLGAMLDRYPWLSGMVNERRPQSIRYLEWLGFYVGTRSTYLNGRAFRAFNLRK